MKSPAGLSESELLTRLRKAVKSRENHFARDCSHPRIVRLINARNGGEGPLNSIDDGNNDLLRAHTKPHANFATAGRLLRFVEAAVLIGLVGVFGYGGKALIQLNAISRSTWATATATPTPWIQAMVMPRQHIAQHSPVIYEVREEIVPPHSRPLPFTSSNIPLPTPVDPSGVRIQIPALKIDAPIVQGDDWEQLKKGAAQHPGSANPGEKGNLVLSGHNDIYGEIFRDLDKLHSGDRVIIFTAQRSYTYVVDDWTLVEPDQVEVMDATPDETLTLISCYPYLIDSQRIIVKARLEKG